MPATHVNEQAPAGPPAPEPVPDEPMVSLQTQLGLLVVAVLAVLSFIFHKDLGTLAEPLTVIALSVYGAAVAIARAMKHRTQVQAALGYHAQQLDAWEARQQVLPREEVQRALHQAAQHAYALDDRLLAVEQRLPTPRKTAKKAASGPVKGSAQARKTSATRKTSTSR